MFGEPAGRLSIQIVGSGRELLARTLDSSRAHTRPSNMSWTPIDSIYLERSLRQLVLTARVITPDGRFSGVQTRVHLRRRQYDPGMGGMANYVMIAPAILLLVIALGLAANMKGRGWGVGPFPSTLALVVTLAAMVLVLRSG